MTKIAITYVIWKRYEILKKQGETECEAVAEINITFSFSRYL